MRSRNAGPARRSGIAAKNASMPVPHRLAIATPGHAADDLSRAAVDRVVGNPTWVRRSDRDAIREAPATGDANLVAGGVDALEKRSGRAADIGTDGRGVRLEARGRGPGGA